jgi:iron complex transport system permease protein
MKDTAHPYRKSIIFLAIALVASVVVGSVSIPIPSLVKIIWQRLSQQTIDDPNLQAFATILFALRLPRTILVCMAGAALAGSGASYQGLFRNPLADPFLIGVASGAGLGAVVAMNLDWPYSNIGLLAIPIAAFLAALLTVFVVYQMARVRQSLPTTNLILSGVAVSSFLTAISSFLMLASNGEMRRSFYWLMGGGNLSGWQPVLSMLPYVCIGLTALTLLGHALNVLQFGDEQARQLGLNVSRMRLLIIVASTLASASAIAFTGIIGFIGLIVPHAVRLLWSSDYRKLVPLSIINGAAILLVADILSRILLAPAEIPLGIITALAGAPFFLWVLQRSKKENYW